MRIKILHSADWQLGRPFASVRDDGKRQKLRAERLEVVRRMAGVVEKEGVQVVMVAGDLFDSSKADRATVSAACDAIGKLRVPVLVIPGNHDHGGPGTIWEQEFFLREQQALAPNLRVLLNGEAELVELDGGGLVVLPAPLLRRHESGDVLGWMGEQSFEWEGAKDWPRVVLAHGTIQGFGSDAEEDEVGGGVANWLNLAKLPMAEVDYVALGDWHGTKQVGDRAWYAGTPEADRFPKGEGYEAGNVLLVTVGRGVEPVVEKVKVGRLNWSVMELYLAEDAGVEVLAGRLQELTGDHAGEHVVNLALSGVLGLAAMKEVEELLESWEARLLRLKLEQRLRVAPAEEELLGLTQRVDDPLTATVAKQLMEGLSGADSEAAEVTRLALRELYAVCLAEGGVR